MDATSPADPPASVFTRATAAASALRTCFRLPSGLQRPKVAIVCGSGLGGLQYALLEQHKYEVPYSAIPGMPKLSVEGHEGKMVFGYIGSKNDGPRVPVMLLVGRAHYYEGHNMDLVTFAIRVCRCLDVETMLVTNAAGGLNPAYEVGDLVLLHDHLNLAGLVGIHPLRGPNEADFGVRFPPLSDAYDLDLRRRAHRAWSKTNKGGKTLHEGVYAFVGGPSYETRAECRMLRMLGADVVGMSTVPEVIVARHCEMRVLAFSLVTNNAVLEEGLKGDDQKIMNLGSSDLEVELSKGRANHEEVLLAGKEAAEVMQGLIVRIVERLNME